MPKDTNLPDEFVKKLPDIERHIRERFSGTLGDSSPLIKAMGIQESQMIAKSIADPKELSLIEDAMRKRELIRNNERSKAYSAFSKKLGREKHICVIPYSSLRPGSQFVGGIGLSEGQHPSGVIVQLDGTSIVSFTTLDIRGGKLLEKQFTVSQLTSQDLKSLAISPEDKREPNFVPELEVEVPTTIANTAFRVLVTDEHSAMIHNPSEMRSLMGNAGIIRTIAELQYMRLHGQQFSTSVSCCSCCCCCWGCCSCCSAVSTANVNTSYYLDRN